ncbi:MAG: ribosome biogenesis GTPase RsgA, partial [Gammaproteobacteria bacterium]|nr:ribosome biogenesis GTPase RsgA [Gammaproteobacteria bacterium]
MSKRKLSRKQAWRVQKIQEERIKRAKKKQANIELDNSALGKEETGIVIAAFGVSFIIENRKHEK